jgi:hypothetical protein
VRGISSNHGGSPFTGQPALLLALLVSVAASAAAPERAHLEKEVATPRKPLDLRAPDINTLVSAEELERLLKGSVDSDADEVKVEGARDLRPPDTPVVWPGLLAPFWALANPTQAWRIFAPLPADQMKNIGK